MSEQDITPEDEVEKNTKGMSRRNWLITVGGGSAVAAGALALEATGITNFIPDVKERKRNRNITRMYVEDMVGQEDAVNDFARDVYGLAEAPKRDEILRIPIPVDKAFVLRFPNIVMPESDIKSKGDKGSNDGTLRIRFQRSLDTRPEGYAPGFEISPEDVLHLVESNATEGFKPLINDRADHEARLVGGISIPGTDKQLIATFGVVGEHLLFYLPTQQAKDAVEGNDGLDNIYDNITVEEATLFFSSQDE